MAAAVTELRAGVDNPFRESALGHHLWAKGWRPCSTHACDCGTVTEIKFRAGKDSFCSNKACTRTLLPFWEHPNFKTPLSAWEIWRRIVERKWGVNIGEQAARISYEVKEEMTEDEKERLRLEGLL